MHDNKYRIENSSLLLLSFFYLSILVGFYFGENLNAGTKPDWLSVNASIIDFSTNFKHTFLNYDSYGHRHSPVYFIFLSLFYKIGLDLDLIRLVHLHLCLSIIIIFYLCLKLKFDKVNSNYLILLSFIIFLSPSFRSLSIWPDSRLPGFIFFILSVYFFLKFNKFNKVKHAFYNNIFLIISSYLSPNFSVFVVFFYFIFLKKIEFKNLIFLLVFNFLASLPMLYYLFVLKINFLLAGGTPKLLSDNHGLTIDFNLSNKILIISSIILFHLFPLLLNKNFINKFYKFIKKNFLVVFLLLVLLAYFFNYDLNYTGGGVFFQFSNIFFKNNYFFFIVCFFSVSLILYYSSLSFSNLILILLIIISNIQNSIYHKYYEPLILILFFLILERVNPEVLIKKNNLICLYIFSVFYILLRVAKSFV